MLFILLIGTLRNGSKSNGKCTIVIIRVVDICSASEHLYPTFQNPLNEYSSSLNWLKFAKFLDVFALFATVPTTRNEFLSRVLESTILKSVVSRCTAHFFATVQIAVQVSWAASHRSSKCSHWRFLSLDFRFDLVQIAWNILSPHCRRRTICGYVNVALSALNTRFSFH